MFPGSDAPTPSTDAGAPAASDPAGASPAGDPAGTGPSAGSPTDAAPPPTESSPIDLELPPGIREFPREYVEKLRGEAGNHRTARTAAEARAAELEQQLGRYQAFNDYGDEDMQVWQQMATDFANPERRAAAAEVMRNIALNVLGDPSSTPAEQAAAVQQLENAPAAGDAPVLTPEQVRELVRTETSAQEQARAQQQQVQQVWDKITAAGYEQDSPEAGTILWIANRQTNGDIDAAIAEHKKREQGVVDRYVQSLAAGGTPVTIPSGGSAGAPAPEPITDLSQARRHAEAYLRERRNAQPGG